MKEFESKQLRYDKLKKECGELEELLDSSKKLNEQSDILPFFKKHPQLCLFLGTLYSAYIENPSHLANEFDVLGDFQADLAVGDKKNGSYCFIEFEDASKTSIFRKNGNKYMSEYAPRFEHGYSQIIDWFWKLEDSKGNTKFKDIFGSYKINYMGILIIGRDKFLSEIEKTRLEWRLDNVLVDSNKVACLTFDQLLEQVKTRIKTIESL